MSKHTPGPWRLHESDGVWVSPPDGTENVICDIVGRLTDIKNGQTQITDEDLANAHLIAAAPELLRCVQGALLVVTKTSDGAYKLRVTPEELRAMRAAIAKAEGLEPVKD